MTIRKALFLLALTLLSAPLIAQDKPADPGAMAIAPLPAPELPTGTVTVRVARGTLANPAVGLDVTGFVTSKEGDPQTKVVKTGTDGRASFAALPPGAKFQARVELEGQVLRSSEFPVPAEGGVRILLMTEGAAGKADDPHAGMALPPAGVPGAQGMLQGASLAGVQGGRVTLKEGSKPGTLVLRLLDREGKPIPSQAVRLGKAKATDEGVEFLPGTSDENGVVRFEGLTIDGKSDYAAVMEREGLRIGTQAFVMGDKAGMEGEIRVPGNTQDPRVLRISASSRMMIELQEDVMSILQNLLLENTSDKVFAPGPEGVFIPLPVGFFSAEKLPGGANLDLLDGQGAIFRGLVPPTQSLTFAIQVRMAFQLDIKDKSKLTLVQPMPFGMAGGLVMVPGHYPITLQAPGLREKATERDDSGITLRIYELDSVPPGGALRLSLAGLPTRPKFGKWIAGSICLILVAGGIVFSRRPKTRSPAIS